MLSRGPHLRSLLRVCRSERRAAAASHEELLQLRVHVASVEASARIVEQVSFPPRRTHTHVRRAPQRVFVNARARAQELAKVNGEALVQQKQQLQNVQDQKELSKDNKVCAHTGAAAALSLSDRRRCHTLQTLRQEVQKLQQQLTLEKQEAAILKQEMQQMQIRNATNESLARVQDAEMVVLAVRARRASNNMALIRASAA